MNIKITIMLQQYTVEPQDDQFCHFQHTKQMDTHNKTHSK